MNNQGSHRRRGTDGEQVSVGAMYRTDVRIESRCRWCHALIEVATRAQGQALERVAPARGGRLRQDQLSQLRRHLALHRDRLLLR